VSIVSFNWLWSKLLIRLCSSDFFCLRIRLRLPFDEASGVVCCSSVSIRGSWLCSVESMMTSGSWILTLPQHLRTIQRYDTFPSFRALYFRKRKPSRNRCSLFLFEIVISMSCDLYSLFEVFALQCLEHECARHNVNVLIYVTEREREWEREREGPIFLKFQEIEGFFEKWGQGRSITMPDVFFVQTYTLAACCAHRHNVRI